MKFKTHNQADIDDACTGYVGKITTTFSELKKKFGKPNIIVEKGEKTDAEWLIQFENGVIATIYNYKNGKNYVGNSGIATSKITDWHIGGHVEDAYNLVTQVLKS